MANANLSSTRLHIDLQRQQCWSQNTRLHCHSGHRYEWRWGGVLGIVMLRKVLTQALVYVTVMLWWGMELSLCLLTCSYLEAC